MAGRFGFIRIIGRGGDELVYLHCDGALSSRRPTGLFGA
jgi:hypothetical protein